MGFVFMKIQKTTDLEKEDIEKDDLYNETQKHKNDVFRLAELLNQDQEPIQNIPETVRSDMHTFLERMTSEDVDLNQIGVHGITKETMLNQLKELYG